MNNKITDYQDFTTKDMDPEERLRLNVGDVWNNSIECRLCHDVIRSMNLHHFLYCSCGAVFVDGGSWYQRYGGADLANVISRIEYYDKKQKITSI